MPDKTKITPIPLVPGIREDVDGRLLPPGSLIAAAQARVKKGGIGKSFAMASAGTNTQTGTFGAQIQALGFAAGRQVVVTDGRVMVRESTGDTWKECGRTSRYRPIKTHWIAFDETATSFNRYSFAIIGDVMAVCYTRTTSSGDIPTVSMIDLTDMSVRFRVGPISSSNEKVAVLACGSDFVFVFDDTGGALYRVLLPSTATAWSGASAVQIGTAAALLNPGEVWDAAPYSSTHFLLAWRVGATEVSTSLVLASDGSIPEFEGVTCANTELSSITTFGTSGETVWTAWDEGASGDRKYAQFGANVTNTMVTPTVFASGLGAGAGNGYKTSFGRHEANTAYMAYEIHDTTGSINTKKLVIQSLPGVGTKVFQHATLASAPFNALDDATGDYVSLWLATDSGAVGVGGLGAGAWTSQRKYWLATSTGFTSGSYQVLEPELAPDEKATTLVTGAPSAVLSRTVTDDYGDTATRHYCMQLAVLRTQDASSESGETSRIAEASALVLYEFEGAGLSAKHRQIVEVGGKIVALGGHVQEVYPNRTLPDGTLETAGVENGYIYNPALFQVVATNGAGLTADAAYAFCATFEYITPSGDRTRTARSNIVSLTPTGNTCQATIRVSSVPFSEREATTLPNRSVIHIWATTGAGNTFQRVTPDVDGIGVVSNTNTPVIEYVHALTDDEVSVREPLYTDLGVVANQPPPAHRFGWAGAGRLVLAGLFDPKLIEISKQPRPNEPVQFTRDPRFRTQLPEEVTAGGFLDNAHVIWSRTGAYIMPSLGPDDTGAPTLPTPTRLPSTVGCLDYRSVVEVPEGLIFQSKRGIELLPRGFGTPRLLSTPVEDTLHGRRVISTAVLNQDGPGERLLVLHAKAASEEGVRLVYDLDWGRWVSIDDVLDNNGEVLTAWDGRLVAGTRISNTLSYEAGNTYSGTLTVSTGEINHAGLLARGNVHRVQLLGEYRGDTEITLLATVDGLKSVPITLGSRSLTGLSVGDQFVLEWPMRFLPGAAATATTRVSSVAFQIATSNTAADVWLNSLSLETTPLPGRPRVGQNRSGGV